MKSNANRKRVPRQHTLTPSRWGANPAETIGRKPLDYLFKRYGLTVISHTAQFPAACSCKLSKINFEKDILSALEAMKYIDNMYAGSWKRLKTLEKKHNIQLLRPAIPA